MDSKLFFTLQERKVAVSFLGKNLHIPYIVLFKLPSPQIKCFFLEEKKLVGMFWNAIEYAKKCSGIFSGYPGITLEYAYCLVNPISPDFSLVRMKQDVGDQIQNRSLIKQGRSWSIGA